MTNLHTIKRAGREMADDHLFAHITGREHSAFPGFLHQERITPPGKILVSKISHQHYRASSRPKSRKPITPPTRYNLDKDRKTKVSWKCCISLAPYPTKVMAILSLFWKQLRKNVTQTGKCKVLSKV